MSTAMRIAGLSALAAVIAHVAWTSVVGLMMLAFLPFLLIGAERRRHAALIMLGYFGYNSLELPSILLRFFDGEHVVLAYAAPALLALLLAAPFALINPKATFRVRAAQAAAAFAITALPPLGFIGWLHPLFAAGMLYPAAGLLGILLTLAGFALTAALRKPAGLWPSVGALVFLVAGPFAANGRIHDRLAGPAILGVHAHDTRLGKPSEAAPYRRAAWAAIEDAARFYSGINHDLLIFPESIIHGFGDVDRVGLAPVATMPGRPRDIWIGATIRRDDGRMDNAIVRPDGTVVARNRLPVPIGNWRPFFGGVAADPFGSDLVTAAGHTLAISICYEDGVLWPHPGLLTGQADALISVGNLWALPNTRTAHAQAVAAAALARMADVPLKRSINQ